MTNGLEAGNTNENLRGTDRDVKAALEAAGKESARLTLEAIERINDATGAEYPCVIGMEAEMDAATAEALEPEPVKYVSRTEFDELLGRVDAFNKRSGHKL
jgi:hypothetical protein